MHLFQFVKGAEASQHSLMDKWRRKAVGQKCPESESGSECHTPSMFYLCLHFILVSWVQILCVSQFTLYNVMKGNSPDFHQAMAATESKDFFDKFMAKLRSSYQPELVKGGLKCFPEVFHADISMCCHFIDFRRKIRQLHASSHTKWWTRHHSAWVAQIITMHSSLKLEFYDCDILPL